MVLRLRKGWSYDSERRRFFKSREKKTFLPRNDLPKYTRIRLQVPSMAAKSARSEAEDELARGIQIIPPRGITLSRLLKRIQAWPCVEKAWISPDVEPAKSGKRGRRARTKTSAPQMPSSQARPSRQ